MAGEGVKIPITVTGAQAAQQELGGVQGAVQQLGAAGKEAGAGISLPTADVAAHAEQLERADREQTLLAQDTMDFSTKGGRSMRAILGEINPEIARMSGLLLHARMMVTDLSTGLVAVAGAGLVIGAVVSIFKELAEAAEAARRATERTAEAAAKLREEGAQERGKLAAEAAKLGVIGRGPELQRAAQAAEALGYPEDLRTHAALAAGLAAQEGIEFDLQTYMAGLLRRGLKPPELRPGRGGAEAIGRVLVAGADEQARRATETFLLEQRLAAIEPPPSPEALRVDPFDAALRRLAQERPELVEKEVTAAGRVAREMARGKPRMEQVQRAADLGILPRHWYEIGTLVSTEGGRQAMLGGAATRAEILAAGEQVRGWAREAGGGALEARVPTTQPVSVQIVNIDTNFQAEPGQLRSNYGRQQADLEPVTN